MSGQKRALWIVAALLIVALVCGLTALQIGAERPSAKAMHIDLILRSKATHYQSIKEGAEIFFKEMGVSYDYYCASNEEAIQQQGDLFETSLEHHPDAIMLSANDYVFMGSYVDKAAEIGIPVIALDTDVKSSHVACYVGTDNYALGWELADQMVRRMGETGKISIISTHKNAENMIQRESGVRDYLMRFPQIEVMPTSFCYTWQAYTSKVVGEILEKEQVDGFICLNYNLMLGTARIVSKMDVGEVPLVVGIDSDYEAIDYLQNGTIDACIVQHPYAIGYLGAQAAYQVATGETVKDIYTHTTLVDRENMNNREIQKQLIPLK